jgi:hypothetical protein
VKAHFATREEKGDWTLLESPWFQKVKPCLHDFKNMMREGYDVADCWGTRHYLEMRRRLGDDHKRQYFLKHLDRPTLDLESLDISENHYGLDQEEPTLDIESLEISENHTGLDQEN